MSASLLRSGQHAFDDVGFFDAGEFHVESAELEGEALMIDTHAMEDGRVEVAVKTRKKLFSRMAKEKSRAFGFHLPWPGLGTVVPKGDQYAWVPERFSWGS